MIQNQTKLTSKSSYNFYSIETKLAVINANNPYLFLDDGVSRTTALYWIQNSKQILKQKIAKDKYYENRIKNLELKLKKESLIKDLLIFIRSIHPYSFQKRRLTSKSIKKQIIKRIKETQKLIPLNKILNEINLSPTTYYRWLTIFRKCQISKNSCQKRKANQLTVNEIYEMEKLIKSKKLSHLPLIMPLVSGSIAMAMGVVIGLSLGGTMVLTILGASASYIAVPAAMKLSLPEANLSLSLGSSLGITFPFNVVVGIPIFYYIARQVYQGLYLV